VGSEDNSLYALNAQNGALLWRYTTGDQITLSSPAVADGKVYFGSNDGNIYSLDATDGGVVWKYPTNGYVVASPAIHGGVVYIGSYDHSLYALNATDGSLLWKFATGGVVSSSVAVANGLVYFGSADGNLYALNLDLPRVGVTGLREVASLQQLQSGGGYCSTTEMVLRLTPTWLTMVDVQDRGYGVSSRQ
jgi:outer membrane protein assembly factor BamB